MDDMLDKGPGSSNDSDDDGEDNGDVALLGLRSPRHHFSSSPTSLWQQVKNIVIEVRSLHAHVLKYG